MAQTNQPVPKEVAKQVDRLQLDINQITRTKSILNQNQIQKLFNSTPMRFTYNRPAKGGGTWRFVKKSYVRRVLDGVFGFNWDFVPETSVQEAFEVAKLTGSVVVKGKLVCRILDDKGNLTAEVAKGDFGRAEVKFKTVTKNGKKEPKISDITGAPEPLDFGNDLKAANSDCLKRCAALWGIAADVYEPEEFMEIEVVGSDEASDRAKATEDKVAAAKKNLKQKGVKVDEPRK